MFVNIEETARLLQHSQPVAIPTETVWGLAACVDDRKGIEQIFHLKGRPRENPLIVHINDYSALSNYSNNLPDEALTLARAFWPGGLTLVIPVDTNRILSEVRADLPTCAFRMPNNRDTLSLINQSGPLVAPSANLSGKPSATIPQHIIDDFGQDFPILSTTTSCELGIESTILIWQKGIWKIGRYGAIAQNQLENVLDYTLEPIISSQALCPGSAFRHYAPNAQLTLCTKEWKESDSELFDGVLGFSDRSYPCAQRVITMGLSNDPEHVAQHLYAALRKLDSHFLHTVFVDLNLCLSDRWNSIIDRLTRAAKK